MPLLMFHMKLLIAQLVSYLFLKESDPPSMKNPLNFLTELKPQLSLETDIIDYFYI